MSRPTRKPKAFAAPYTATSARPDIHPLLLSVGFRPAIYGQLALKQLGEEVARMMLREASLTQLAVWLRDATATMKTPSSALFRRSMTMVQQIAGELQERGRVETIKRADATFKKGQTALEEAQGLVHGDRNNDYGHPGDSFRRIAAMARALFGWDIKSQDVGLFMILLKLDREKNRHKRDNLVDLAGYAEVVDWIHRDGRAEMKPFDGLLAKKEVTFAAEPPKP